MLYMVVLCDGEGIPGLKILLYIGEMFAINIYGKGDMPGKGHNHKNITLVL